MVGEIVDNAEGAVEEFSPRVVIAVSALTVPTNLNVCDDLVELAKFHEDDIHQLFCIHLEVLSTNRAHIHLSVQHGI